MDMLITRETDYALRLLRALGESEPQQMTQLTQQEQVPRAFAYKILGKLGAAGFVQATRGAQGGYYLAVDLSQRSLYDLMQAMEEDEHIIACMNSDYPCTWQASHGICHVHQELARLQRKLDDELRACNLATLLQTKPHTKEVEHVISNNEGS